MYFLDDTKFIQSGILDDNSLYFYIGDYIKLPVELEIFGKRINQDNLLCLKYLTGKGFYKHNHLKINEHHLGDVIIFPPSNLLKEKLEGGDLIIYDNPTKIIKVSELEEWKVIFLPLMVEHEVTEITRGIRYSFKYDLYDDE